MVPLTVLVASANALASVTLTLLPEVIPTVLKLLVDVVKVTSLVAPAVIVVAPVTLRAPVCVILPVPLIRKLRSPAMVLAPNDNALSLLIETAPPLFTLDRTAKITVAQ